MNYQRKTPLDYKDIIENLRCPAWWDIENPESTLIDDAAKSIEDLLKYKEAIERMGSFGTLFVKFKGDPRGPVGPRGIYGEDVLMQEIANTPVLEDVEGDRWIPLHEEDMRWILGRNLLLKVEKEKAERERDVAVVDPDDGDPSPQKHVWVTVQGAVSVVVQDK